MSVMQKEYVVSGKHYAVVYFSGEDYEEVATNIDNLELLYGLRYQIPNLLNNNQLAPTGVFENQIQNNLFVITFVNYVNNSVNKECGILDRFPAYFNFLLGKRDYSLFHNYALNFERYLSLCLLSIDCIAKLREVKIRYDDVISAFFKMNGLLVKDDVEEVIEIEADSLVDCFNQWYYDFD